MCMKIANLCLVIYFLSIAGCKFSTSKSKFTPAAVFSKSQCQPVKQMDSRTFSELQSFNIALMAAERTYLNKNNTSLLPEQKGELFIGELNKIIAGSIDKISRALKTEVKELDDIDRIESGPARSIIESMIQYRIARYLVHETITFEDQAWGGLDYFLKSFDNFDGLGRTGKRLSDAYEAFNIRITDYVENQREGQESSYRIYYAIKLKSLILRLMNLEIEQINYRNRQIYDDWQEIRENLEYIPWIYGGSGLVFSYVFVAGNIIHQATKIGLRTALKIIGKKIPHSSKKIIDWASRAGAATVIGASGSAGAMVSKHYIEAFQTAKEQAFIKGSSYTCELAHYAKEAAIHRPEILLDSMLTGSLFGVGGSMFLYPFKSIALRIAGVWGVEIAASTSAAIVTSKSALGFFTDMFEGWNLEALANKDYDELKFDAYQQKMEQAKSIAIRKALYAQEAILVGALAQHLAFHSVHAIKAGAAAMHALYASGVDTVPTAVFGMWDIFFKHIEENKIEACSFDSKYKNKLVKYAGYAHGATIFDAAYNQENETNVTTSEPHWKNLYTHLKECLSEDLAEGLLETISGLPATSFATINPTELNLPKGYVVSEQFKDLIEGNSDR
ncbi:MAG: hypothetical protein R3B45_16055 [Bdellovibrionota bacterium]